MRRLSLTRLAFYHHGRCINCISIAEEFCCSFCFDDDDDDDYDDDDDNDDDV